MGRKQIDLSGQNFHRLTVIEQHPFPCSVTRSRLWKCRCVCGKEVLVRTSDLRSGHTQSCGCLHKEGRVRQQEKYSGIYIKAKKEAKYDERRRYVGKLWSLAADSGIEAG